MLPRRILIIVIAAAALGCASAATGSGQRSSSQILTQSEIASASVPGSAYDVISHLRPQFLVSRGQTSVYAGQSAATYANIYVDGLLYGDINSLKYIEGSQIDVVRMYPAWEAATLFGSGNPGGVIAITLKR
jgi:hypothetical protein